MTTFPADRYLRAARRRADLSQRELAARAALPQTTVARIEHSPAQTKVDDLARLLACMQLQLIVVDETGTQLQPEDDQHGHLTDRSGRRFPAHLDVRPGNDGWWGAGWPMFDGKTPQYTFDRAREERDWRRANAPPASPD